MKSIHVKRFGGRRSHLEPLEARQLCALQTIDFGAAPVKTGQLDFLTPSVHTPTSGFSYELGTGAGRRQNVNGITWPDSNYYESALGGGGFEAIDNWVMRAPVVYATTNASTWSTTGWKLYQDMAEGSVDVDDAGRAAMAYADAYLLGDDASAFQRAKDVLTFVGYMTTRQGNTYNFAWLDAPQFFTSSSIQSQDKHYMYRVEYNKRTAYPSATPNGLWNDPNSTPSQIVGGSSNPQAAPPFRPHEKYSVYINDLRDANGNDVAPVYDGPLYNTSGALSGYKTGIKSTQTNSTLQFGFDEVRALQGSVRGLTMLQKFAKQNGGLIGDNYYFARFAENETNRLINNMSRWLNSGAGYDTKLGSAALSALAEYAQLRDTAGGNGYGRYVSRLPANSNTPETTDDAISAASLQSMIDTFAAKIRSKLVKTSDYRNGVFSEDGGNSWEAYGELQIAALATTYRMKIAMGSTPASVAYLLDDAAYAADEFYGKAGWHYKDEAAANLANTRQRTLRISGGTRITETSTDQIAYGQSSVMLGLEALADAYEVSDRPDKVSRASDYREYMRRVGSWFLGNNSQRAIMYDVTPQNGGAFTGIGAAFDGLGYGSPPSSSRINRGSGSESNVEAIMAWAHLKHVIDVDHLATTLTFDSGTSTIGANLASAYLADSTTVMSARRAQTEKVLAAMLESIRKRRKPLFGDVTVSVLK